MGCGSSAEANRARGSIRLDQSERPTLKSRGPIRHDDRIAYGCHSDSNDSGKDVPTTKRKTTLRPRKSKGFIEDMQMSLNDFQPYNAEDLFFDDQFPADQTSLFYDRSDDQIVWKRPKDLVPFPQLLIDGESRNDVMQGALADCWFLSSCASVAQRKTFINHVIPDNQVLFGPEYKGVVRFRFWRFGKWVDVHVDDRLPVKHDQLVYARNSDPNEFWVSLLEKAYAKLHGSYEALEGGQAMDALVDLTGGLAERYELLNCTEELYQKMNRASEHGAFIACSRKGDWKSQANHETDECGLVLGHAYTVTSVKKIKRAYGHECLVRVRNPWGDGQEWTGAWSDGDHRWKLVSPDVRESLDYFESDDGEFWMSFKDFCEHFQEVTICTVGPDFDGDYVADPVGHILLTHGSWIEGECAGGCRNKIDSFATNPQYLLTVLEPEQSFGSFPEGRDEMVNVVVSLMQEHRRCQRHLGVQMLQISFILYQTDDPDNRLTSEHFLFNHEVAKSGPYVNFREISSRLELSTGSYVLIPSTYRENEAGTFLLRVFGGKRVTLKY